MALIDSLAEAGEQEDALLDLVELNPFAVQYRYETLAAADDDKIDRSQILQRIQQLFDRIHEIVDE